MSFAVSAICPELRMPPAWVRLLSMIHLSIRKNYSRCLGSSSRSNRELPGRPELLGTTREFLDYFGLRSVADLPPLAELRGLDEIDPQLALPVGPDGEAAEGAATDAGDAGPAIDDAALAGDDGSDADDDLVHEQPLSTAAQGLVAAGPTSED